MPRSELVATKLDDDRERPPGKPGPRHNASMSELPSFAELATAPQTPLDLLALALAAEFRGVDAVGAIATLGVLGAELPCEAERTNGTPGRAGARVRSAVGRLTRVGGQSRALRPPRQLDARRSALEASRPTDSHIRGVHRSCSRSRNPARRRRIAGPLRSRPLRNRSA